MNKKVLIAIIAVLLVISIIMSILIINNINKQKDSFNDYTESVEEYQEQQNDYEVSRDDSSEGVTVEGDSSEETTAEDNIERTEYTEESLESSDSSSSEESNYSSEDTQENVSESENSIPDSYTKYYDEVLNNSDFNIEDMYGTNDYSEYVNIIQGLDGHDYQKGKLINLLYPVYNNEGCSDFIVTDFIEHNDYFDCIVFLKENSIFRVKMIGDDLSYQMLLDPEDIEMIYQDTYNNHNDISNIADYLLTDVNYYDNGNLDYIFSDGTNEIHASDSTAVSDNMNVMIDNITLKGTEYSTEEDNQYIVKLAKNYCESINEELTEIDITGKRDTQTEDATEIIYTVTLVPLMTSVDIDVVNGRILANENTSDDNINVISVVGEEYLIDESHKDKIMSTIANYCTSNNIEYSEIVISGYNAEENAYDIVIEPSGNKFNLKVNN